MDERVQLRRGGWFATGDDRERGWSGPWRTKEAAEAADREDYTTAHDLDRAAPRSPNDRGGGHG